MTTEHAPVRVLAPADLWAHAGVGLGALLCLSVAPLLQAPGLAARLGPGHGVITVAHAAGAVLTCLGILLHAARLCVAWLGGAAPFGLLPRAADARQLTRALAYGAGLRASPPAWGRFSYREKIPYLAFALGLPVALATGLAAGHPAAAVDAVGVRGLSALYQVHAAAGALLLPFLLWHLFFSHLQPGALWWNTAWLTGKTPWHRVERLRPGWARELAPGTEPEAAGDADEEARSVEHFLSEGNRAAREGRFAEAEAAYLEALRLYPGYSQALFNLGVARWRAGRSEPAREALERFLEQDPFNPMAERAREILDDLGGGDLG